MSYRDGREVREVGGLFGFAFLGKNTQMQPTGTECVLMLNESKSCESSVRNGLAGAAPEQGRFFETDHLFVHLKRRSVQGCVYTVAAQSVKSCLQIGATVILARLLAPQDFGLIAMVAAVTGFVLLFKDMGLSLATVQKSEISHAQISTLFWINVGFSVVLMLVTALLGPVLAWFYSEPRLTLITIGLASAFIFGGATVQHQALLRRQMRFGTLAVIGVLSALLGVVAAVVSAWFGVRYWALVIMQLTTAVCTTIGVWLACSWRPGLPGGLAHVKSMLTMGGHVTGFNIVNYLARNLDKILVGRCCGSFLLGLYDRAYQVVLFPIVSVRTPLLNVAVPALSRLKDDPDRYRNYYRKLILLMSMVSMPVMVFCLFCSESVIVLLLGNKWIGVNNIFKVLAIVGFIEPVAGTRGSVLVSLGQSGRCLLWGLLNSVVLCAAFAIGVSWGILGVAIGYAIAVYCLLVPSLGYCFRLTPLSISVFFSAIWRSITASLAMGLVLFFCLWLTIEQGHVVKIVVSLVAGTISYFLTWVLLPDGAKWLSELYGCFSLLFGEQDRPSESASVLSNADR